MRKPLRPYLFNAYYNYFVDNGETVYIHADTTYPGVVMDEAFKEFIDKNSGQICFNISPAALGSMEVGDHLIIFKTRLKGKVVTVYLPMGSVVDVVSPTMKTGIRLPEQEYYDRIRHESELEEGTLTLETDDGKSSRLFGRRDEDEESLEDDEESGDDEKSDDKDETSGRQRIDLKKSPEGRRPFSIV